ncbi:MAG: hypothetical protein Q9187_001981 [Circinaria calcarea]
MQRLIRGAVRQCHISLVPRKQVESLLRGLPIRPVFTSSKPSFKDDNGRSPVSVRWYEQLFPGSVDRKPIEPEDIDGDEAKELRARISQLEQELQDLQTGKSLIPLSPEDRSKVKEAITNDPTDSTGSFSETEHLPDALPCGSDDTEGELQNNKGVAAAYMPNQNDLEIKLYLPLLQAPLLRHLNSALSKVSRNLTDSVAQQNLWRWYTRCKQSLPPFLSLIPDTSWDVLWESQYRAQKSDRDRPARLRTILDDMVEAGRHLTVSQRMTLIECLLLEGRYEEAIRQWESNEAELRANKDTAQASEDLGVRVYSSGGRIEKAEKLAFGILNVRDKTRARTLIPVIAAWVQRHNDDALKHAWALYIRLREDLGSDITLDDYDRITMCFLNAGHKELALAVFKDLMLVGQTSGYDSSELYRTSLGLVDSLQSQSLDAPSLSKVSLTALTVLPRKFQNKFFYGSWMKKLLGMGEVDAAASVIELMYQRNVKPDPKHLNGIMGAWLRSGNIKSAKKALQMGWAMIHKRLELVAKRYVNSGENHHKPVEAQVPQVHIPPHLQRTVPPATIETFSLLLLYYERRSMLRHVEHLRTHLALAEITPNAYFMNHILYAELRRGNYKTSWKTYRDMSNVVRPDLETYACLWDCEKAHLGRVTHHLANFPTPRYIFCDMITFFSKLNHKAQHTTRDTFSRDLYDQIIRCFCLAHDLEGTVVALYALKDYFHLYPDLSTLRMISLQVARMEQEKTKTSKSRRQRVRSASDDRIDLAKVAQVLELLTEKREQDLQERHIKADELGGRAQLEEQLFLLAEFVRMVLAKNTPPNKPAGESIEQVAWEMGVGGIRMGDPLLPVLESGQ